MEWKRPEFDEKIFDPNHKSRYCLFLYNSGEMSTIISEYLMWFISDYPVCKQIMSLLQETILFRSATAPEDRYIEMRKQYKSGEELSAILEKMANALRKAQSQVQTMKQNSMEYKLLASAIEYCEESVSRRIQDLAEKNDMIYATYWPTSTLKKIIMNHKVYE